MVSNVKSLTVNDDVLALAVSPDAKYIAVSLSVSKTVKVRSTDFPFFFIVSFLNSL